MSIKFKRIFFFFYFFFFLSPSSRWLQLTIFPFFFFHCTRPMLSYLVYYEIWNFDKRLNFIQGEERPRVWAKLYSKSLLLWPIKNLQNRLILSTSYRYLSRILRQMRFPSNRKKKSSFGEKRESLLGGSIAIRIDGNRHKIQIPFSPDNIYQIYLRDSSSCSMRKTSWYSSSSICKLLCKL